MLENETQKENEKQENKKSFDSLKYNEKIERLKSSGYSFAQKIYNSDSTKELKNIIQGYAWKLFNYIYTNKKDRFVEYLERICASYRFECGYNIDAILKVISLSQFRDFALAFMCGFLSEKKNNSKIQQNEGGSNE